MILVNIRQTIVIEDVCQKRKELSNVLFIIELDNITKEEITHILEHIEKSKN